MQEVIIKALRNRFREMNRVSKGTDSKATIVRKMDSDSYKPKKKLKLSTDQSMNTKLKVSKHRWC